MLNFYKIVENIRDLYLCKFTKTSITSNVMRIQYIKTFGAGKTNKYKLNMF